VIDIELAAILRGVQIRAANAFAFDGQLVTMPPANEPTNGLTGDAVSRLQHLIYQRAVMGQPIGHQPSPSQPLATQAFLASLSAANTGQARWDEGWRVIEALPSGQVIAEKSTTVRLLYPGEFATFAAPGNAPAAGATVSVYCPKEFAAVTEPFYFAFGETPGDYQDDQTLARFYWNIRPDWAASLTGSIVSRMNRFRVPFRMKCLADPASFPRRDGAVLYVARRLARNVAGMLAEPYRAIVPGLEPGTPLLTRVLAPGVAFAEDPGGAESFGTHRARLIAEAINLAHIAGKQSEADRLAELQRHFARNGLDLSRPYMSANAQLREDVPPLVSKVTDDAA
jgi:hypothetical protein